MQHKAVVGESSIVLKYKGEVITIQKATDAFLFDRLKSILANGSDEEVIEEFVDIKAQIELFSNKNFYIKDERLYLKGDDTPLPELLGEKLLSLKREDEDFMPLIRFWKNLKQNPSEESVEQAYGFIRHNNIPITETGHIVVEKGVRQKQGAPAGEFVDCYTGKVDNSIGMEVYMDRDDVDSDPEVTCSHGLHVGAPKYVRDWYNNNVIVVCTVNPRDIVSVPVDYNNTKMRVCRYNVVGFSDKTRADKNIYRIDDFLQFPDQDTANNIEKDSSVSFKEDKGEDEKVKSQYVGTDHLKPDTSYTEKYEKKFSNMGVKEIVQKIADMFNLKIKVDSKEEAVKRASKIAGNHDELNS